MANHCNNQIEINGSAEEIKAFKEILNTPEHQENIYYHLKNLFGEGKNDARWFDIQTAEDDDIESLTLYGDSAWTPCLGIFTSISKKYPSFRIRYTYDESGCDFAGNADIENGNCDDHCFNYWKGLIENEGEDEAVELFCMNELDEYESIEELLDCSKLIEFSEEARAEIVKAYNEMQTA